MSEYDDKRNDVSRFATHLKVLGIEENGRIPAQRIAKEKALIEAMPLPELRLTEEDGASSRVRAWTVPWKVLGAASLPAFLVLFLFLRPQESGPTWQYKGGGQATVYYELQGKVATFEKGTTLPEGTKVRAEVSSPVPATAFLGMTNDDAAMLISKEDMWTQRMTLDAGEKKIFPGSLELIGAAEGETVVVITCRESAWKGVEPEQTRARIVAMVTDVSRKQPGCESFRFKLR